LVSLDRRDFFEIVEKRIIKIGVVDLKIEKKQEPNLKLKTETKKKTDCPLAM
jgi:hypothetical protein